jgi:hypothetical protein
VRPLKSDSITAASIYHAVDREHPTLQADFSLRPRDADRPYDPATRRGLLSTEHVLDAGPNSALLAVRVLLRLR